MLVHLGEEEYRFPSQELAELEDHTELYLRAEWDQLRGELERRGYLRIRQLHDREQVLRARTGNYIELSTWWNVMSPSQPYWSMLRAPEVRSSTPPSRWRLECWTRAVVEAVFPSWREGTPSLTIKTSSRSWRDPDLLSSSRNSSVERF